MSIYTLGIDIGSTASKCVILADGKEIVAKSLIAVGAGTSGPQRAISQVLENAGMKESDIDRKSTRLNSSHSRASRMPSSA